MSEPPPTPEEVAERFHTTYERLAPSFGYKTREASAVPWKDVPEQNRALMVAVAAELLLPPPPDQERNNAMRDLILRAQKAEAERDDYRRVLQLLRDFVGAVEPAILDAFVLMQPVDWYMDTDIVALTIDGVVNEQRYHTDPLYHALVTRVRMADEARERGAG